MFWPLRHETYLHIQTSASTAGKRKKPLTGRGFRALSCIQHFQQTVVCLENALGFCNLPQLPVKALDRVRGIDQTADLRRIFEVGAEVRPVFPPRLCDLGIFIVPILRKSLQSVQSSLFVHCCIYKLFFIALIVKNSQVQRKQHNHLQLIRNDWM